MIDLMNVTLCIIQQGRSLIFSVEQLACRNKSQCFTRAYRQHHQQGLENTYMIASYVGAEDQEKLVLPRNYVPHEEKK